MTHGVLRLATTSFGPVAFPPEEPRRCNPCIGQRPSSSRIASAAPQDALSRADKPATGIAVEERLRSAAMAAPCPPEEIDMDAVTLLAFALTFFVFAASPGPDNMTIVLRTISHGPASGLAYGGGTVFGILVFLSLAGFGLSVLATEMGTLMTVLRFAGAAYLVWMGIRLWTAPPVLPEMQSISERGSLLGVFCTGIALNLGNPKMPLFYIALLPNVVGTTFTITMLLELATIILAVEAVVIGGHVLLAVRARRLLRTTKAIRRINRAAGGLMIGTAMGIIATR